MEMVSNVDMMHLILVLFVSSYLSFLIDYFVLWDEKLVRELSRRSSKSKARALLHKLELPYKVQHSVNKGTIFSSNTDSDWLSKAQDLML
jgi:hypothetical protein